MANFSEYPYIDYSDLNLDWIIKRMKEVLSAVDVVNTDIETLRAYVEDYFQNLDITDEVDAKIAEMMADGTFSTYITTSINRAITQLRNEQTAALNAYKKSNDSAQAAQNGAIAVLEGRVNNLVENPPATSTELTDVRVAFTGARLSDAGNAMRSSDLMISRSTQNQKAIYGGQNLATEGWVAGRLAENGSVDSSVSGWFTTGYIPVSRAHGYLIEQLGAVTAYTQYRAEYNSSHGVVSGRNYIEVESLPRNYQPSADSVAFVRFSMSEGVYKDGFVLREVYDETLYKKGLERQLNSINQLFQGENLIDNSTWQAARLISGGGVSTGDGTYWTCGYIPVEPGKIYELYVPGLSNNYTLSRTIYDKNFNVIGFLPEHDAPPVWSFRAFPNYAYVRYSVSINVLKRGICFRRRYTNFDQLMFCAEGTERRVQRKVSNDNMDVTLNMTCPFNMTEHRLMDGYDLIPDGTTGQAFDTWDRYLFQCCANNTIRIFDMSNGFAIYQDVTGLTFGHGNACSFYKYGAESRTLAISDGAGNVYLYVVTKGVDQFTFQLARTLYLDPAIYGYNAVFCYDNSISYGLADGHTITGYAIGTKENATEYTAAKITAINPNVGAQHGNYFSPTVLVPTVEIPLTTPHNILQGCKCLNGQIFITSGGTDTAIKSNINVIAFRDDGLVNTLALTDFADEVRDNEIEDCAFIQNPVSGRMDMIVYVRTKGYWRYTL